MSGLPGSATRLLAAIVILGALVVGWLLARDTDWWRDLTTTDAELELPSDLTEVLDTAIVTRADVSDQDDLTGELRYQDEVRFVHRIDPVEVTVTQRIGVGRAAQTVTSTVLEPDDRAVTELPVPGAIIAPGDVLYETDSTPVYAIEGDVAAWRTMDTDASGPDVAQLQRHLLDGGWGADELVDDGEWSTATTAAVEAWQTATGQEVTGEVALGDVWFIDGPIRITEVTATEGLVVADGEEVFAYTSDRRAIEATVVEMPDGLLDATDLTARLPDGSTVPARLTTVRGSPTGFGLTFDVELPESGIPVVDGLEVTMTWTVNELVDALTLPPEALRRMDSGTYVVDVLEGDVIRTTDVAVLGQAGRVVAVEGVPERTQVLVP